jgi:hypothetical protein
MENIATIIGAISLISGLLFLARYFYLDYKAKKEKSFIIISVGLLLFWVFGGIGLTTLGILLLLVVLIKGC